MFSNFLAYCLFIFSPLSSHRCSCGNKSALKGIKSTYFLIGAQPAVNCHREIERVTEIKSISLFNG